MNCINRRDALRQLGVLSLTACGGAAAAKESKPESASPRNYLTLGFGTYGLPNTTVNAAAKQISAAGFDSIEIAVTADRDAAPEKLNAEQRKTLRTLLADLDLELTSLQEQVKPLEDEAGYRDANERMKRAAELARDLTRTGGGTGRTDQVPLVQTILGGKDWATARALARDRLGTWKEIAEDAKVVICVKPHRGNAMSTPADAVWLLDQLGNSPWLRMVYDYSHYAFRDMPLDDTVRTALPVTGHIAVKDAVQEGDKVVFALPGEAGSVDYPRLLKLFYDGGYRGDVSVEVSAQLWKRPGFSGEQALADSYRAMDAAFRKAEAPRRR